MRRSTSKSNIFDISAPNSSESPPLPRHVSKKFDESSHGRQSYKLRNNASESNAVGGWAPTPQNGHGGDIFDLLPVQQTAVPSTYSRNSRSSRRDSFEFQIPAKSSGRGDGENSATDLSSGRGKRRSFANGEKVEYSTEKLPTVAQLRKMQSISGIDASSPIAPLTKLRSIRSLTELAAGGPLSPRQTAYAEDNSKDQRNRRNSGNAGGGGGGGGGIATSQDAFDKSGFQDANLEALILAERKQTIRERPGPSLKNLQPSSSSGFGFRLLMKPTGPCLVSHHIVLGGREEANDRQLLKNFGVTHVLNVAQQLPNYHEGSFIYLKIPILDAPDVELLPHVKIVSTFISHVENVNGRVLVHCIAGVSRSVSLILMYMISAHKICLLNAYNHIKSLRGFIHPNDGFKAQLAKFEVAELGYSSVTSKTAGSDWDCYAINSIKPALLAKSTTSREKRVPTRSERFGRTVNSQGNDQSVSGSSSSSKHDPTACCVVS